MKRFLMFAFTLVVGFTLAIATATASFAGKAEEPAIVLTPEQWMQIQDALGQQTDMINREAAEKFFWFDQYTTLKQCVREATKNGTPPSVCIGDLES